MRRRVAAAAIVAVAVLAAGVAVTTPVAAQTDPSPGPFGVEELRQGGEIPSEAPEDVRSATRYLRPSDGGTPTGWVQVQFDPLRPLGGQNTMLEPGTRVSTRRIDLFSSAFGSGTGEYQAVIVYWDEETRSVNGTDYTVAADQTVQRVSVDVAAGYGRTEVQLRPHYDSETQVTMWLERDGRIVPGARWRFSYRTSPLMRSPGFPTGTKGSMWQWAGLNLLLPAVAGLAVSGVSARHVLDRTVVGTLRGVGFWVGSAAVAAGIVVIGATWQTSLVLAHAPYVVGILLGLVSFPIMLSVRDSDLSKAAFLKRELHHEAISPSGDKQAGTRKVETKIKEPVVRDETLFLPARGIRPALARYWADSAAVPKENWESYDRGEGDLQYLFEVDPDAETVLDHTPAHLAFDPHPIDEVADENLVDPPEQEGISALPAAVSAVVSNWIERINWRFVTISTVGFAAIYFGVVVVVGSPWLGGLLGLVPMLVESTEARDGSLEVEWGPAHWNDVQAQVQYERAEYDERQTFDAVLSALAEVEWNQHEDAERVVERVRTEIQKAREEEHGGNYAPEPGSDGPDPIEGVGDD